MIWGIKDGERVKPQPNLKATCPICKSELTPKCGVVKQWHWAHKNLEDCDSWSEGETEWHLNWKMLFPAKNQEVVVGKHRADIKTDSGRVIELQNSPLSQDKIYEREYEYEKMIWLLNRETFAKNLVLRNKGDYITFRWKWPPKSWEAAHQEIFIDFNIYDKENNPILHIKKVSFKNYCGGWGVLLTREAFLKQYGK